MERGAAAGDAGRQRVRGAADTIFAWATGQGAAAIAVCRISGAEAASVLSALGGNVPAPRRMALRTLRNLSGEVLDRALVAFFPRPESYSGEDMVELHVHGGRAVRTGVADALITVGARPAQPGEFTRRAVLNGRMDLLDAEGVAALVAAETSVQRSAALRQMGGETRTRLTEIERLLTMALARLEAAIDFPDEVGPEHGELKELSAAVSLLEQAADGEVRARRLFDGVVVAVIGGPNAGKSSLVNALCARDVAIVSPSPGTTRDAIETVLDLEGFRVTLVDTAGLRETGDFVEREGVRRAKDYAARADIVLVVSAPDVPFDAPVLPDGVICYPVANKVDLFKWDGRGFPVSAKTGEGLGEIRAHLASIAREVTASSEAFTGSVRVFAALKNASSAASRAYAPGLPPEIRAEHIRLARLSLARAGGNAETEAVLDQVFSSFCIGK